MARETLTRGRVLAAAMELADAEGLEALSMRRLAQAVGVKAMSLYNHVASKDDVLDGITDLVVAEIEPPRPDPDWRVSIRARTLSARRVLQRHPWAAVLLESRRNAGAARLDHYEALLAILRGAGFSLALAHRAFLLLDSHLYGFLLQEQAWPYRDAQAIEQAAEAIATGLPANRYPYLRELLLDRVVTTGPADAGAFAFGLDLILDGLERARAAERRPVAG